MALDVAVVSPFTPTALRAAADECLATAKAYAQTKRRYKDTQRLCEEAGIGFEPIIFESTGGLDPEGQKVLESVFRGVARSTGKDKAEVVRRMKGRISIDLCRAQSRALHRRKVVVCEQPTGVMSRATAEALLEVPPEDGEENWMEIS